LVIDVSMLSLESTAPKLASCPAFFALINVRISKFFQFGCLGFFYMIYVEFESTKTFCLPFPDVLVMSSQRFIIHAIQYKFFTSFPMHFNLKLCMSS
jgi:hypothetical protein